MIKLKPYEDVHDSLFGDLLDGEEYLIESQALTYIANKLDGHLSAEPIYVARRNRNPSSFLILRAGGAGYVLFLTPIIHELKRRYPGCFVAVACFKQFDWVLRNNREVDKIVSFPIEMAHLTLYDCIIDLEDTAELDNTRHIIDAFALKADVELADKTTRYAPIYRPEDFDDIYPKVKTRVGVHLHASTMVRTYVRALELINLLRRDGIEVAVFALPGLVSYEGDEGKFPDNFISVAETGWDWGRSTDFLQTCDVVVGPDSSVVNFAGAMNIPTLGIFGSFRADLRVAYQPTTVAYQARGACAPCFHHGRRGQAWPTGCPGASTGRCEVLAAVDPEKMFRIVKGMLTTARHT